MRFVRLSPDGGDGGAAAGSTTGGTAGGAAGGTTLGAAGGAAAPAATPGDWRASLPVEIRDDPSITKFTGVPDLAKSYVHAQRLIGTKRMEAPQETWTDKEWGQLYDTLGRPKEPGSYILPEGVTPEARLGLDDAKMGEVRKVMHGLGLSEKQGRALLGHYVTSMNSTLAAADGEVAKKRELALAELQGEYGAKLDEKVLAGKNAVMKLGGERFARWLDTTKAGDDPEMVRVMVKIGEMLREDSGSGAGGQGGGMSSAQQQANDQIRALKVDKTFMEALTTQHHAGHAEAVARWAALFQTAFPGKQIT